MISENFMIRKWNDRITAAIIIGKQRCVVGIVLWCENLSRKKVMCDAICGISGFLQNIDSSSPRSNWYDTNIDDVHVSSSCYETRNIDLGDISEGKTYIEYDDSGDRWTR